VRTNVVEGQKGSGAVTVVVSGELDATEVDEFWDLVHRSARPETATVVLHLGGITYMGSTGMTALIRCLKSLAESGVDLVLDQRSEVVQRVLDIGGVTPYLEAAVGPDRIAG
jgi:anti-sigma B factor antagonist